MGEQDLFEGPALELHSGGEPLKKLLARSLPCPACLPLTNPRPRAHSLLSPISFHIIVAVSRHDFYFSNLKAISKIKKKYSKSDTPNRKHSNIHWSQKFITFQNQFENKTICHFRQNDVENWLPFKYCMLAKCSIPKYL